MKRGLKLAFVVVYLLFLSFFLILFALASNVVVVSKTSNLLMWFIAIALWILYILYLWKILNERKK